MNQPFVPVLFTIRHEGERYYLLMNLMPLGYWMAEDFKNMKGFAANFMCGEFKEIILPRLTFDEREADTQYVADSEMSRAATLSECAMIADLRARYYRSKMIGCPTGSPAEFDYKARAEEAESLGAQIRERTINPKKGGYIQ